jgi:UDP-GlcNAc:undecaprenyl-phosphate GlcNAc-1-phosphate transferase
MSALLPVLLAAAPDAPAGALDVLARRFDVLLGYLPIPAVAFAVTFASTPLMRRLARRYGVVDHPDPRKVHRNPIPYLGGVAVFLGILAALSYATAAHVLPALGVRAHATEQPLGGLMVDWSFMAGLFVVMLVGLLDDIIKVPPRVKLGGQLFAAAALALNEVGVRGPAKLIMPIGRALGIGTYQLPDGTNTLGYVFDLGAALPVIGSSIHIDLVYWTGTAMIAVFILGACNASNLIDGLDGLASGVTAVCALGLLWIALALAAQDDGSLLLGFTTIAIVLMLGDTGHTYLVLAGLVIYAVPLIDTVLAILRRTLAGRSIAEPDAQHLHHLLKAKFGGVRPAVHALFAAAFAFAVLGAALSEVRARWTYLFVALGVVVLVVVARRMARRLRAERAGARAP